MKIQNSILRVALLSILLSGTANIEPYKTEKAVFIYYQSGNDLMRISLSENSIDVVASDFSDPISFSPDNSMIEYSDNSGVWISNFPLLDFQNIVTDPIHMPMFGGPFWTPDSRYLIFSYANRTRQGELPDRVMSYIYDRVTDQVSEWSWGTCSSLVRNRAMRRVALKCDPIASNNPITTTSIALSWSGEQQVFAEDDFETLLENIEYPGNFDWYRSDQVEQVIYIAIADFPYHDIYISETGKELQSLGLAPVYTIQPNIIAVSPDRTMVAYIVECHFRGPRYCMQISELTTGSIVWSYENTISLAAVGRLEWSPDNRYVVMLGNDISLDPVVSVFDSVNGASQEFFIEYSSGNLAVTLE